MDNLHQVETTREAGMETDGEDLEPGATEQEEEEEEEEAGENAMEVDSKDEEWSPAPRKNSWAQSGI